MRTLFHSTLLERRGGLSLDAWQATLRENRHVESLQTRLTEATAELNKARAAATSRAGRILVLRRRADLGQDLGELDRELTSEHSLDLVKELANVALALHKATFETLEVGRGPVHDKLARKAKDEEVFEWLRERLDLNGLQVLRAIRRLRNYSAHEWDATQQKDWRKVQRDFARRLGRRWRPDANPDPNRLHQATDIQLTALEATELKLAYIEDLAAVMQRLLESVEPLGATAPEVLSAGQTTVAPNKGKASPRRRR